MEKLTYNANELAQILGISRSAAYDLMHREDFPSFRVGKRLLILCTKLDEWLEQQSTCLIA